MVESVSEVRDFSAYLVTFIIGATILVIVYISRLFKSAKEENIKRGETLLSETVTREKSGAAQTSAATRGGGGYNSAPSGGNKKKSQNSSKWRPDSGKQNFSHPWLVSSFKGHGGPVHDMEFSPNGKFLASCGEDRAIFIWNARNLNSKDHKSLRHNVEYDHASLISWSPDSRAFVINRATENVLEVYKVNKKPDGWISSVVKGATFPKLFDEYTIALGISSTGKYIMSCSCEKQLIIWDLKGSVLAVLDTYLINTYQAKVSPCGRFVAASGFAPDVKVWEVVFAKTGEFKHVTRSFELQGHSSGVFDFGFNSDTSKMATVSKDGTWKVFNVKIEFEKGEDPHLLLTGKYNLVGDPWSVRLALSPIGDVLAISVGVTLMLFNAATGECDKTIPDVYSAGVISRLLFDSAGEYVLTSGLKHVRVLHNVTGRRTAIAAAKQKLRSSANSAATKERLESIVKQAEKFLNSLGESTKVLD